MDTHPPLPLLLVTVFPMAFFAEYCCVLQEESERVCGTALPQEIIHLILLKWGGLRHPAATAIHRLMSPVHEVCGFNVQIVPHHSILRDQLAGEVAPSQVDPDATRLTLITNSHWLREERGGERPDGPHSFTMLRDGRVLVYGMSGRLSQSLCRTIRSEGVWWGANSPLLGDGLQCSKEGLWMMAAAARGVPLKYVAVICQNGFNTETTKAELCALLWRAETDHSWKFWYDLASVCPKEVGIFGMGLGIGAGAVCATVGLGAWAIQKRTPSLSYSKAVLIFMMSARSASRFGLFGLDCIVMGRRWGHSIRD